MKPSGLSSGQIKTIRDILSLYPEVEEVVLFGSRAKGSPRRGSDVDLALRGDQISPMTLARLQAAMDESNLPFRVDLVWQNAELSPDLTAHILRSGQLLYKKSLVESR
jgi:predicted nucleotidyltransferase